MVQSLPAVVLPWIARQFALTAGLPALVLLGAVSALSSVADGLAVVSKRAVVTVGVVVGLVWVGVGLLTVVLGGGWTLPALVVGLVVCLSAIGVSLAPPRIRFRQVLSAAVAVTVVVGLALEFRVDAFGWRRPMPIAVQSMALVGAGAAFAPLGFATRRGGWVRWPLAAAIVTAPFVVVAPAVPVGGIGPFFVGALLSPWAVIASVVGATLFALGWTAAHQSDEREVVAR